MCVCMCALLHAYIAYCLVMYSMEVLPVPTMTMLKSNFFIPGDEQLQQQQQQQQRRSALSSARTSKDEQLSIKPQASELFREAKIRLDHYRTNQFNQLGRRVNNKLQSFLKQLDGTADDASTAMHNV